MSLGDPFDTDGNIRKAIAMQTRTPLTDLAACIDANRPVLLMGAPGTAKTAMIEALAAQRGAFLEVVIASAQDPTTILGIPMPTEDRKYTESTIPGWARRINEADAAGKPTILFLDELTSVPPSVAAPLLGIVQSRRSDGWTLPAETRIVAAANPPDLAVGGWALEPAMANRWVHIDWPAPTAEWVAWAKGQSSPALTLLGEYIETLPDQLLQVPVDIRKRSGPWPSPRAWTNGAALIDQTGDHGIVALTVGVQAAGAFLAWVNTRDVPTVAEMLSGTPLPQRQDAFVMALRALEIATDESNLADVITILRREIGTDASSVANVAISLGRRGLLAGIASLVDDLRASGIDFDRIAADAAATAAGE